MHEPTAPHTAAPVPGTLRHSARWWEPRRLLYNLVLTAVFVALAARTWEHFSPELSPLHVFQLGVLALLANLCYCAAYAVDLAVFASIEAMARNRWRWALFLVGTLGATFFETYWFLDEILPPPR
jgi:hypothetical protein